MRPVGFGQRCNIHRGRRHRQRHQIPFESYVQHFIHVIHEVKLHDLPDVFRDVRKVLLIVVRHDHFVDAVPVRRQQFFLKTADRQNIAAQRDFPRHRDIAAHRDLG